MSVSKFLDYSSVKPIGVPSKIKMAKFIPQSAYGTISSTDTIRFQINSPGFWDPYSAYFNIEIEVTDLPTDLGFSQLDGSAHSFINQLIIYSKGIEVERIQEYDGLAEMLSSVTYSGEQRAARKHEGYGSKLKDSLNTNGGGHTIAVQTTGGGAINGVVFGNRGFNPLSRNFHAGITDDAASYFESIGVMSQDYVNAHSNVGIASKIAGAKVAYSGGGFDAGHKNIIGLERADLLVSAFDNEAISNNISNTTDFDRGYVKPFNAALSNGCNEARFFNFSNPIIKGGIGTKGSITKRQFSIPILSGLLGVLMPRESYKYVPMAGLEDIVIELKLNKYALFSSGFSDEKWSVPLSGAFPADNPFEKAPVNQISRNYRITKFELMGDIAMFERNIEDAVLSKLDSEEGIILHTSSWYLGPQFNIANTASAAGTWQINMGFESLKSLAFYYELNDYTQYNYCRKHFRVSRNLTYLQLKIGLDYYPTLAIEGHAGNIANSYGSGNNSEFLINTYKAFNKLWDASTDNFLNTENFAINTRMYNVAATGALYSGGALSNIHTACGLPGFFENSCVGRAIYGLNLEALREDFTLMSGINTIQNKPFELTIRTDGINDVTSTYDRPCTMYVFCFYDFLVRLKKGTCQVLGRG